MSTKKHQREVIAAIESEGAQVTAILRGRKHIHLRCKYADKRWQQTISVSSSSHREKAEQVAITRRNIRGEA